MQHGYEIDSNDRTPTVVWCTSNQYPEKVDEIFNGSGEKL